MYDELASALLCDWRDLVKEEVEIFAEPFPCESLVLGQHIADIVEGDTLESREIVDNRASEDKSFVLRHLAVLFLRLCDDIRRIVLFGSLSAEDEELEDCELHLVEEERRQAACGGGLSSPSRARA